jgi:hypothetical protein
LGERVLGLIEFVSERKRCGKPEMDKEEPRICRARLFEQACRIIDPARNEVR